MQGKAYNSPPYGSEHTHSPEIGLVMPPYDMDVNDNRPQSRQSNRRTFSHRFAVQSLPVKAPLQEQAGNQPVKYNPTLSRTSLSFSYLAVPSCVCTSKHRHLHSSGTLAIRILRRCSAHSKDHRCSCPWSARTFPSNHAVRGGGGAGSYQIFLTNPPQDAPEPLRNMPGHVWLHCGPKKPSAQLHKGPLANGTAA